MNNPKLFYYSLPKYHFKYKTVKNIPEAVSKVQKILNQLSLVPQSDIRKVVSDNTKAHYSAVVLDSKKNKYFIKIKFQKNYFLDKIFERNLILSRILSQNPEISLIKYIPRVVEATEDYTLSEFTDGMNLGYRYQYNYSIIKKSDLALINGVLASLKAFPIKLFNNTIESYGWDYFLFLIFELTDFQANARVFESHFPKEMVLGIDRLRKNTILKEILDTAPQQLCHGDFKPNNLMLKNNRIYLVDWDAYGIGSKYIDISYFYDKIYRQPQIQKKYLIAHNGTSIKSQILQYAWLFAYSFSECFYLIGHVNELINKSTEDAEAIKKIFKNELDNTTIFFHNLIELV
ncbi:hypothetical protein COY90_04915 [Candidatus Roizmanbacteria bacterium CG_4_10_14_0_8_um_filter_39_9]|uniref:Aminoglycoside phosphotransferase domain-containing protein n=1 Tax=Candidatus Roizmanbacteria bacterium CG_4_10_14_0_8_um_filter_39_9 TaxID=1974829 RepID=A0A2M7QCM8_9BACT|nr:MAG: hypothetical protein COY90_04915 [Candidatus Roizmanbacteria bacterium CG_4_10_14_0_8_um_filter_39_9]